MANRPPTTNGSNGKSNGKPHPMTPPRPVRRGPGPQLPNGVAGFALPPDPLDGMGMETFGPSPEEALRDWLALIK